MTLTTVVVAAFDVDQYLSGCLDSILLQTTRDIEVIVVDDGSTDTTGEIADSYADFDRRIRVIHQRNGGLSAARNAGLSAAHGDFVLFIDGDDWVDPRLVERMTSQAHATAADVVVAGCHVDTHDNTNQLVHSEVQLPRRMVLGEGRSLRTEEADRVFVNLVGYAWNKLYRRELLVEHGLRFEEGLSLIEDVVFNEHALTHASHVTFVDEAFVHYVQRPHNTLGTRPYADFLSLRLRAIETTERILVCWGVPGPDVANRVSEMSLAAVISAVRSAATRNDLRWAHRSRALQQMLANPDAVKVLELAGRCNGQRARDRGVLSLVASSRYGLALVPALMHERFRLARSHAGAMVGYIDKWAPRGSSCAG